MKVRLLAIIILAAGVSLILFKILPVQTSGGWRKSKHNPVLGGELGTCFDVSVLKEDRKFRMWFSWRPKASIALTESRDGIRWSNPVIVLGPKNSSGWEDIVSRPLVLKRPDGYHMWYTGHGRGSSYIGYAVSADGKTWKRVDKKPVLSPELPWEKVAVMVPHVIWDQESNMYRMWYSGGELNEPDAIGYATSRDGRSWTKWAKNPIFVPTRKNQWERSKVTASFVVQHGKWYIMFYIGFENPSRARIGIARSLDGITNWQRHPANPIIRTGGLLSWDRSAVYKPAVIFDGKRWLLWYNGRSGSVEQIGLAIYENEDLGF